MTDWGDRWRKESADPHSLINDERLSTRARSVLGNESIWTRADLIDAMTPKPGEMHPRIIRARNCGPKTREEFRRFLDLTRDRDPSWDTSFGVPL